MSEDAKSPADGSLQKVTTFATDALQDGMSSLDGSAYNERAKRLEDFSLHVCRENLDRLVRERSFLNAIEIHCGEVAMSPLIRGMLEACFMSLGGVGGTGATWVVCAPTHQGKTIASQFLIHGNHSMIPKRSLKIDATNMTDFAKEVATILQCSAAEPCLAQLLCEALSNTAPLGNGGENKAAKASSAVINACSPGKDIAFDELMQMQNAEQHKLLKLDLDGAEPAPILILDEFYCDTEENKKFIRKLLRDASAAGIVVFLMTRDPAWASKLIELNGGLKCKPLQYNVNNAGYNGSKRFTGTPDWNEMFWEVNELRELIRESCKRYSIKPEDAIPLGSEVTPGEAQNIVMEMRLDEQLNK
jgi:hypothetical protein